jgi:hypothetical protein
MAKLKKLMNKIAAKNPNLSAQQVQNRAQNRIAKRQGGATNPIATGGGMYGESQDPLAQGATQLFGDIQNIGGGANGNLSNILAMLGGGGQYNPVSYSQAGGVRDIGSDAVNINLGQLRNALTTNANYALGQNLGALDARVAQGGLPGSSRHGVAQANTIADSDRNLQSTLAQANYQAYDADAARRLQAAQSNQSGDIATMNANAGLQGQAMGANAQLQAAAMGDMTNRLGIAGNIANDQSNVALQRNQMLLNALGQAYDRSIGYKALNNQTMADLSGQQYDYATNALNQKYGLMNNQQNRALQYNMFGDDLNFQRENLLSGLANAKNDTMNLGLSNSGNMSALGQASLNPYSQYMDLLGGLGNLFAPILTGNTSANSQGWSRGSSNAFGFEGGGGVGGSGGSGGGGSNCPLCFIFMEAKYGDGTLDDVVRKYRDEAVTPRRMRGYYKLGEVLVPLMRKSKIVKGLVRLTMVDPLVSYGKYYYGKGKIGKIFTPVKNFWMKMFDYLGQDHEFIRENGEVV